MESYLTERNGTWYIRMRVPTDLVDKAGKKEIKQSLGTKDKKEAQRLLRHKVGEIQTYFDELSREPLVEEGASKNSVYRDQAKKLLVHIFGGEHPNPEPLRDEEINELAVDHAQDFLEFDDKWRASGTADEKWLKEWRSTAEDMEGVCRRAYGLGQADQIFDDEVDELLRRMGLVANENQKRLLAIAVAKAMLPAVQTVLQRLGGEIIETREAISSIAKSLNVMTREEADKVAAGRHTTEQEGSQHRFQRVFENFHAPSERSQEPWTNFIDDYHVHNATTTGTIRDYQNEFDRLERAIGRKAIDEVSRSDIIKYRDIFFEEAQPKKGRVRPAKDTQAKAFGCIRNFFDYAKGQCLVIDNPASHLKPSKEPKGVKEKFKKAPWSQDDLQKVFHAPLFTGCKSENRIFEPGDTILKSDGRYWMALIALMTGARIGELQQMLLSDVEETDEFTYLHVRIEVDENDDDLEDMQKSLKTENSKRRIAVHPELVRCGFLDYLARRRKSKDSLVFERRGYGQFFNDPNRFFDKCGVKTLQKSFHSFRHLFRDMVRSIPSDESRDRLLGHAPATAGHAYGSKLVEDEAKLFIQYVKSPIDLSHLYAK